MTFTTDLNLLRQPEGATFRVLFTGDVCPKSDKSKVLTAEHPESIVADVAPYFAESELRLMQWECALTDHETPIAKSGPNLKVPAACRNLGKALNINVMLLANNHVGDYGPDAVADTVENLRAVGFVTVGAGKNLAEAEQTVFLRQGDCRIALINFAENEFGGATETTAGVAPMSPFRNLAQIRAAKESADVVIVAIHGGHETYNFPSPRMIEFYRECARAGASLVWNCHPHCVLGTEIFEDVPIVYSPGNFYFPYPGMTPVMKPQWHTGFLTKFHCDKRGVYGIEFKPYAFDEDHVYFLSAEQERVFIGSYNELSTAIADESRMQRYFEAWCTRSGMGYLSNVQDATEPSWPGDWSDPEVVERWLKVRNLFWCESHHALMKQTLFLIQTGRVAEAAKSLSEVLAYQNPKWVNFK